MKTQRKDIGGEKRKKQRGWWHEADHFYYSAGRQCCSVRESCWSPLKQERTPENPAARCTPENVCVTKLLLQIRNFKAWKTWEYPGPHYHILAFSQFSLSFSHARARTHTHPPSSRLPGPASVYCQCMVTMCRLVTECRPASEGLGPAYRTTS